MRCSLPGVVFFVLACGGPATGAAPAVRYFDASVAPCDLPARSLSAEDRGAWMYALKRSMMKPGCCGACAPFDVDEARLVWSYVTAVSDGDRAFEAREAWFRHWRRVANEFLETDPNRFSALYGRWPKGVPR